MGLSQRKDFHAIDDVAGKLCGARIMEKRKEKIKLVIADTGNNLFADKIKKYLVRFSFVIIMDCVTLTPRPNIMSRDFKIPTSLF